MLRNTEFDVDDLWVSAAFTADPTSIVIGDTVRFTDLSKGAIMGWLWDFGDGDSSTLQHPVHVYSSPPLVKGKLDSMHAHSSPPFVKGTQDSMQSQYDMYTVELTIYCAGTTDTETKPDFIRVYIPPPCAAFSADDTSGVVPHTVDFADQCSGCVTQRLWDFGDGHSSSATNPTHEYTTPGTYDVSLIASGPAGSDTALRTDYIEALWPPPVADFYVSGNGAGLVPLAVDFVDISTGNITDWSWHFGDGDSSHQRHPTHVYMDSGTYTVDLRVTGPGGSDVETRTDCVTVYDVPDADFTANDTSGGVPQSVRFIDQSAGYVTSWTWSFGDGDTTGRHERNPRHIYNSPGLFSVTLQASNPYASDYLTIPDYIHVYECPAADFDADSTCGEVPLPVTFSDLSGGVVRDWFWDFGDGATSLLPNPMHVYRTPGIYDVTLSISGPGGADTLAKQDFIDALPSFVVLTSFDAFPGPGNITCTWSSALEIDHAGFNVYRSVIDNARYSRLNSELIVEPYVYVDDQVIPGETYFYKLGALSTQGIEQIFGPVRATARALTTDLTLRKNVPNPFNPSTRIFFEIPEPGGEVTLQVLDISGRVVKTLCSNHMPPGLHSLQWDGTDQGGGQVGSGVYLAKLTMGGESSISKTTLLK
jgi:PKD repeat protein